jgi:hypothetical protein
MTANVSCRIALVRGVGRFKAAAPPGPLQFRSLHDERSLFDKAISLSKDLALAQPSARAPMREKIPKKIFRQRQILPHTGPRNCVLVLAVFSTSPSSTGEADSYKYQKK